MDLSGHRNGNKHFSILVWWCNQETPAAPAVLLFFEETQKNPRGFVEYVSFGKRS